MFSTKKIKDKSEKASKKDKGNNAVVSLPGPSSPFGSSSNRTSFSTYNTTNIVQTTEIRTTQSVSTRYGSLDNIQKSRSPTKFDFSIPEFKRFSVDATPFTTASSSGYQSIFSRRLAPMGSSPTVTSSTTPSTSFSYPRSPLYNSSGITSSFGNSSTSASTSNISSNPFSRKDRIYNSERAPNKLSTITYPRQTSVGSNYSGSVVPEYNTKGSKRGHVLVINNIKFLEKSSEERNGAEHDEKDVIAMFRKFGFDVEHYRNLKRQDILEKVKKFKSNKSLTKCDMSIVIVMSHGSNRKTIKGDVHKMVGGYTEIIGVDGGGLSTEEIVNEFTAEKCSAMKGKPKIFIFQCCRGDVYEFKVDSSPIAGCVKNNADVLIAYSTLPGFYSLRDPEKGSWYIQCICQVFQQHARVHHVEDMLKIVDDELSKKHPDYKQTSTYENRGFKKCFLNPR